MGIKQPGGPPNERPQPKKRPQIKAIIHPQLMTANEARGLAHAKGDKGVEYILGVVRTNAVLGHFEHCFADDKQFLDVGKYAPQLIALGYSVKKNKSKRRWVVNW